MIPTSISVEDGHRIVNVLSVGSTAQQVFLLVTLHEASNALNPDGQVFATTRARGGAPVNLLLSAADALSCLWVSPAGHLWVASSNGIVYTTHAAPFAPPAVMPDIETPDPGVAWQVGALPRDGLAGIEPQAQAIWGTSDDDVFVGSAEGAVFHWNGSAWQQMTTGVRTEIVRFAGAGPADVYAVGEDAVVLHFDGRAWSPVPMPEEVSPTDWVIDIHVHGASAVACTRQGKVLHGNPAGFRVLAESDDARWFGITVFDGEIVLSDAAQGVWALRNDTLTLLKGQLHTLGVFNAGDHLYFIESEQPQPAIVDYDPSQPKPWGRRKF